MSSGAVAGYVLGGVAVVASAYVALVSYGNARFDAGVAKCEAVQAEADKRAADALARATAQIEDIDDDTDDAIRAATDAHDTRVAQFDAEYHFNRGRREGRARGRAEVIADYANRAGACLPARYSTGDGMRERSRSLQTEVFGDRADPDSGAETDTMRPPAPAGDLAGPAPRRRGWPGN